MFETGAIELPVPPKMLDKKLHLTLEFLYWEII